MNVNQVILYGFAAALAVFALVAYLAHRNMRAMVNALEEEKKRLHKMEKLVGELEGDLHGVKQEISRKVEERSLQRILAETVEFLDKHAPAMTENRIVARG